MGMARCGEPSPFLVGVVPSRQESFATALDRSSPENIAIIRRFISPSLFTNVLVTKAE